VLPNFAVLNPGYSFMKDSAADVDVALDRALDLQRGVKPTNALQRRLLAAFLLASDAGLFQVELAFDAAARFVGDLAVL
jgi:hypothetical protein